MPVVVEVGEKSANFVGSHICGMAPPMQGYVPFRPINIDTLDAQRVVFISNVMVQLIEQSGLSFWYRFRHALFHVYLTLYKYTVIVPRLALVRFAGY